MSQHWAQFDQDAMTDLDRAWIESVEDYEDSYAEWVLIEMEKDYE